MHLNLVICSTRWRPLVILHRAGDAVLTPIAQMTSPLSTCRKPARSWDPKQGPNWHHTRDQGPAPWSWGWGEKQRGAGALNITSSSSFFLLDFFLNFFNFLCQGLSSPSREAGTGSESTVLFGGNPCWFPCPTEGCSVPAFVFPCCLWIPSKPSLLHRARRSTRSWKKAKNLTLEMKRKMHSLKKQKLSEGIPVQGKKILFLSCLRGMISSLC